MPNRQHTSRRKFIGSKQAFLFLVFAAVIWLLSALSETYTATVEMRVELKANNTDFLLLSPNVDIPVRVSGTGFYIVYRKLVPRKVQLLISDIPSLDIDNPAVDSDILLRLLRKQHSNTGAVLAIEINKIKLPITASSQKSFAPVLRHPPLLADGYQLISPLEFSVDSISVFGNKAVLDKLENAIFELEKNTDLKSDFELQAKLVDSLAVLANWDITSLTVSGKIDRYSDVSFVLPVTLNNAPDSNTITITPKQVAIKFAAPLAALRSLNATNLRAEVVFNPNESGELAVRIIGLPSTAKQLIVEPSSVNYFILE